MRNWMGILLLFISAVSCNDDVDNDENTTTLVLNFNSLFENNALVLTDIYPYTTDLDISINSARFFISNINLVKENGDKVEIKDIGVVDFAANHNTNGNKTESITIQDVPIGTYTNIEFGIGVDSVLNGAIPPDFDNDHPLAAASEYWDWRATYIFSKLEGRVIRSTGEQTFFVYHAGTNVLYKEATFQKNITLEKDAPFLLDFSLDAKSWFAENGDLIDIETNNSSHSGPDDIWLADLIMTNLINSIQIRD